MSGRIITLIGFTDLGAVTVSVERVNHGDESQVGMNLVAAIGMPTCDCEWCRRILLRIASRTGMPINIPVKKS